MNKDSRTEGFTSDERDEIEVFAEFKIQDYLDNPTLIKALTNDASRLRADIKKAQRSERNTRRDLIKLRKTLSDQQVENTETRTELESKIARLEMETVFLRSQLTELRRLSTLALIISWIGLIPVAAGVNIMTGEANHASGFALIVLGAILETLAYFVRHQRQKITS
jgi:hypothetical protein